MRDIIELTICVVLLLLSIPLSLVTYNAGIGVYPAIALQFIVLCRMAYFFAKEMIWLNVSDVMTIQQLIT